MGCAPLRERQLPCSLACLLLPAAMCVHVNASVGRAACMLLAGRGANRCRHRPAEGPPSLCQPPLLPASALASACHAPLNAALPRHQAEEETPKRRMRQPSTRAHLDCPAWPRCPCRVPGLTHVPDHCPLTPRAGTWTICASVRTAPGWRGWRAWYPAPLPPTPRSSRQGCRALTSTLCRQVGRPGLLQGSGASINKPR